MKNKGIGALAEQVASKGRGGDSILMHIQPEELAGIAALLGQDLTINPETGMPEAFSWKKLLGAIGIGAAAALTGGAAAGMLPGWLGGGHALGGIFQTLGTIGKGVIPKVLATVAASQAVGAATPDQKKQNQEALTQQAQWKKDTFAPEYGRQVFDTTPWNQSAPMTAGARSLNIPGGSIAPTLNMAEGGELEPEEEKAQQIVRDAMDAIRGEGEDPEAALNTYLAYYGKDALQDLYKRMSGENEEESESEGEEEYAPPEGMIKGPGNGMDDMATARMAHGGQKVLLSNDEFIIPADVVSGLGDGSSEAGARKLYAMMDRVRMDRTGSKKQPGKIKDSRVLPA